MFVLKTFRRFLLIVLILVPVALWNWGWWILCGFGAMEYGRPPDILSDLLFFPFTAYSLQALALFLIFGLKTRVGAQELAPLAERLSRLFYLVFPTAAMMISTTWGSSLLPVITRVFGTIMLLSCLANIGGYLSSKWFNVVSFGGLLFLLGFHTSRSVSGLWVFALIYLAIGAALLGWSLFSTNPTTLPIQSDLNDGEPE